MHSHTCYFKDNCSHTVFYIKSAVLWLLCEINIILYSTFEVITPSVEIICEEGWVTQLLLEAAHVEAKGLHFSSTIFNKTFHVFVDGGTCENSKRRWSGYLTLLNIPPLILDNESICVFLSLHKADWACACVYLYVDTCSTVNALVGVYTWEAVLLLHFLHHA